MKTTQRLLDATREIWDKYNEHPFVKGIENGTLDKEKFRYYIIQDFIYLEDYTRAFALGVAKAKSERIRNIFANYITLLTDSEMDIHHGYMGKFGISQDEVDSTELALDNISYTSYMLRVAYEEGEAEILTAILSCAYSYEVIAKNMIKNNPDCINDDFYGEWIRGYAGDYCEGNVVLMNALDELTADYNEKQLKHLTDIFIRCSEYELRFWKLSWTMDGKCEVTK